MTAADMVPLKVAAPFTVRFGTVKVEPSKVKLDNPPKLPLALNCTVDEAPLGVPEPLPDKHTPLTEKQPFKRLMLLEKVEVAVVEPTVRTPPVVMSVEIVVEA